MSLLAEPRIEDLTEEANAKARITEHLAGKPIVGTSGDEEHQLTPVKIDLPVTMTENGDQLSVAVTHLDRHHPSLVAKTLVQELAMLPEFGVSKSGAQIAPQHFDVEKDYVRHGDKGLVTMTIRYEVPGGEADDIIHSLSKNHQNNVPLPESQQSLWANKVETVAAPNTQSANDANWATKALNYLGVSNSRA